MFQLNSCYSMLRHMSGEAIQARAMKFADYLRASQALVRGLPFPRAHAPDSEHMVTEEVQNVGTTCIAEPCRAGHTGEEPGHNADTEPRRFVIASLAGQTGRGGLQASVNASSQERLQRLQESCEQLIAVRFPSLESKVTEQLQAARMEACLQAMAQDETLAARSDKSLLRVDSFQSEVGSMQRGLLAAERLIMHIQEQQKYHEVRMLHQRTYCKAELQRAARAHARVAQLAPLAHQRRHIGRPQDRTTCASTMSWTLLRRLAAAASRVSITAIVMGVSSAMAASKVTVLQQAWLRTTPRAGRRAPRPKPGPRRAMLRKVADAARRASAIAILMGAVRTVTAMKTTVIHRETLHLMSRSLLT